MKPPYDITTVIFQLATSITMKIGQLDASQMTRPPAHLRKVNRIRSIHSSLGIEGNTLTLEQVTALINNRPVAGPRKDILEVLNAIKVYDHLGSFNAFSPESFLEAHAMLMEDLVEKPGKYRSQGVGVFKGSELVHLAPPARNVYSLMQDLFGYLKQQDENLLIRSCVFHYELEFIHPFPDGNGRMGRLWQMLILRSGYPVFEFVPFESLIKQTQEDYYKVLVECDKVGKSNAFIEYMLGILDRALAELLDFNNRILNDSARLEYFAATGTKEFTRKDYMNVFKNISTATASRDLKKGTDENLLEREGLKNKTTYKIKPA
jgi:Fic family protein